VGRRRSLGAGAGDATGPWLTRPETSIWLCRSTPLSCQHQYGATLPGATGVLSNHNKFGEEPRDHAIGRRVAG
jgi:hypothetical protein